MAICVERPPHLDPPASRVVRGFLGHLEVREHGAPQLLGAVTYLVGLSLALGAACPYRMVHLVKVVFIAHSTGGLVVRYTITRYAFAWSR